MKRKTANRNPMAKALSQTIYRKKVIKSKKGYDRKRIAGENRSGDYFSKAA